ncbi:50S ribosomal protein L18e [Candidatus Woesearchaeota archaeon]|nr:50S ribosomal protein L18e [Candidatus Woesearchaeota archaeon]
MFPEEKFGRKKQQLQMAKRTGPTNPALKLLIQQLRKESSTQKAELWKRIADDLEKPTRQRRVVNLSRINRFTKPQETIIIPGKVLGTGMLEHGVTIAAFAFSGTSKQKIEEAKGKAIMITELLKQNPKGKDVRIIG